MANSTISCPQCGANNLTTSKFCLKCGRPLVSAQAEHSTSAPRIPQPQSGQSVSSSAASKSARRFRIFAPTTLFGLADVLLLVVGVLFMAFTLFRPTGASGCPTLKRPDDARVADSRDVISGKLTGFIILGADQTYDLRGEVRVAEEATLQIEPGARLLFDRGSRLVIEGLLHACGTRGSPIVLTSVRDGASGGPGPEAGDWQGLVFEDESSDDSILSNVHVRYTGQDRYPAILLKRSGPTFADLRITDSAWFPISADPASEPTFSGALDMENVAIKGMEVRGGDLYDNVTWDGKSVVRMITDHITVKEGGKLTIKPGLTLKFAEGKAMVVEGVLQAAGAGQGSPSPNDGKSIVFTSWRDDEVAGDSDLRTAEPKPGDWRGLVFQSSNRNTLLQHVVVRYAGQQGAGVSLTNSNPELRDVLIEYTDGYGLSSDAASVPQITNVVLRDNRLGSGWEIRGGRLSERKTYRWPKAGSLVRVVSDHLTIDREATLIIESGAVIRFELDKGLYVDGTLEIAGDEKQGVVFSSIRDDAEDAGGDIDGSDALPVEGDWRGISFSSQSNDKRSAIRHALIRYAEIGLAFDGVSPTVENVTIERSGGPPLHCINNARPTLTNIKLYDNAESETCSE